MEDGEVIRYLYPVHLPCAQLCLHAVHKRLSRECKDEWREPKTLLNAPGDRDLSNKISIHMDLRGSPCQNSLHKPSKNQVLGRE